MHLIYLSKLSASSLVLKLPMLMKVGVVDSNGERTMGVLSKVLPLSRTILIWLG